MRRMLLNASLFFLGFTSIVGQVFVLRELTINFYGNEFFLGLALASWLAWVAAGSVMPKLGKLGRILPREGTLPVLQIAAVLLLFATILAIRSAQSAIGLPGEIPNLFAAALVALLAPAPVCLLLGAWWTAASEGIARGDRSPAFAVSHGYLIETIGFIAGGVLASLVLVTLPSFIAAFMLAIPNLALAALALRRKPWLAGSALVLVAVAAYVLFPSALRLERASEELRFERQRILEIVHSPFGQLAVTMLGDQRNFFESGLMIGSDAETFAAEKLVHIPLLSHPKPESVLLLGGGWSGALSEILEHGAREVFYLELDPALIGMADRYLPPLRRRGLAHQNVHLVYDDGYHFLRTTSKRFDAIIVNLPAPSTALINRYYTEEFFRLAVSRLDGDGVLATQLPYAPDQPAASLAMLDASVVKAMEAAFPHVLLLPEEDLMLIGSRAGLSSSTPGTILERFDTRGIENDFVTKRYVDYRLTNDRIAQARRLFAESAATRPNREFRPVAYYYQTLFWLDHFHPTFSRAFDWTARHFWPIALVAIALSSLALVRQRSAQPMLSAAVAGFSLMASEFAVIFVYQTVVGFLYYRLALLIAALMAGMALGVWLANRALKRRRAALTQLAYIHAALVAFSLALFPAFEATTALSLGAAQAVLLVLAELAGMLGALIFPVANDLYMQTASAAPGRTGVVYGADVAGSALGAILPSVIIIPLFGVWQALLFVALVNVWAIVVMGGRK